MYVRGIGARMDQPAVGLNVDNVPILNKNGYDFDLADIESGGDVAGAAVHSLRPQYHRRPDQYFHSVSHALSGVEAVGIGRHRQRL